MDGSLFEEMDDDVVHNAAHNARMTLPQDNPDSASDGADEQPTLFTDVASVDAAQAPPAQRIPWEIVPNAVFDEVVARIIMDPASEVDALSNLFIRREADGSTLLHVVAGWTNCHELVERLLDRGIPPDTTDHTGWTPLLEAAQEGQISICEVLLAHGATPDLALGELTPLRAAAEVGNEEMVQWLLQQQGTWSGVWDTPFFSFLLDKTPGAVATYLDRFATVLNHSKRGLIGVRYTQLRYIYGEPHVPVDETPLALVVRSANARDLLSHRVMKYLLRAKWKSFAKAKFRREFTAYAVLLASYYVPTIGADPDWTLLETTFDYWVAASRFLSWTCCVYLLVKVELHEFMGDSVRNYFLSFWNLLNILTYVATLASIPLELQGSDVKDVRNSVLALITVSLWVNLLQFLQVSTESGLLIAMMSNMVKDVYRFLLLYAVFVFGYTGAFYLLLRGQSGYESFINSFITVFLMLFGAIDYSVFSDKTLKGWLWYMGNTLLLSHLVSVVIVLLNILIAMMATTYADVWDSAEAQALQSHALAIIRMEKSLQKSERTAKYLALLQPPAAAATVSTATGEAAPSADSVKQLPSQSSRDVLTSRSAAKRAITQSVLAKFKALPLAINAQQAVNRALAKSVQIVSPHGKANPAAVHPDMDTSTDAPSMPQPSARPATASAAASAFLGHLIDAPNLNVLEQTLFLKSAFDQDDETLRSPRLQDTLATLDDGIRYELPVKKAKEDEQQAAIRDLQMRVEQLTKVIVGLHDPAEDGDASTATSIASRQLKRRSTFLTSGARSAKATQAARQRQTTAASIGGD